MGEAVNKGALGLAPGGVSGDQVFFSIPCVYRSSAPLHHDHATILECLVGSVACSMGGGLLTKQELVEAFEECLLQLSRAECTTTVHN